MFRPQIQKTRVLLILAIISVALVYMVSNSKTYINNFNIDKKYLAVDTMIESINLLKEDKSYFSDEDIYKTGLIGNENSDITTIQNTDSLILKSKIATSNPNFSAFIIDLFEEINLESGDSVAISMTGSFPGANIAVLSACKALNLYPVIISSLGSSAWGANTVNNSWLEIEKKLNDNNIINYSSIGCSIGGENDIGDNLSDKGIELIEEVIAKHDVDFINESSLEENILKKVKLYKKLDNYSAFINIGGNASSLGPGKGKSFIKGGIINPMLKNDYSEIYFNDDNLELFFKDFEKSISYKFLDNDIPLINIKNINSLLYDYGLDYLLDPDKNIVKEGDLYYDIEKFNVKTIWFSFIISILMSLSVGIYSHFEIRKKMKEDELDSII